MAIRSVVGALPEARPLLDSALEAVVPALNWFFIECDRAPEAGATDPAALLRTLKAGLAGPLSDRRWPDLDPEVRALAFEVGKVRNRHAHHEVFTYEEAFRGISSVYRLVDLLGAPGADRLAGLLDDLHSLTTTAGRDYQDDDDLDERLLDGADDDPDDAHDLTPAPSGAASDGSASVAELIWQQYGVEVPVRGAFDDADWHLQGTTDVPCPTCHNALVVCRQGDQPRGRDSRPWACVCTTCATVRRLLSYDVRTKARLRAWAEVDLPVDRRHL